jgi:cell division protein FtsB
MRFLNNFVGIHNRLKLAIRIGIILISIMYFVYQAINGENGIISYVAISKKVIEKKQALELAKKREISLEKDVHLLSNNFLDLDLLEERSRIVLNYALTDDTIISEKELYCP